MTKRTRVVIAALVLVVGFVAASVTAFYVATTSSFGNSRVRGIIESNVGKRLAPGVTFHMGELARGPGGAWVVDSVLLTDSTGSTVLSIARVTAQHLSLTSLIRGDIRLGIVIIDGARFSLERGRDGVWNTSRLFVRRGIEIPGASGFRRRVLADSVEVRNSRFELILPDSLPSLPRRHRAFTGIQLASGTTTLLDGDAAGAAPRMRFSLAIDDPPVQVQSASGSARWWRDSIELDLKEFRLPATRGRVAGSIAWGAPRGARLALDVIADTIAPADIKWMSTLIPSEGAASARVAVRTTARGDISYRITEFDLRAFDSHVSGGFVVTPGPPGRQTEVRDLHLAMAPLDLKLVRNVFGDTILKPAWQGAFDGRLTARGGLLDSMVIDSVVATYRDARFRGATSRFAAGGAIDVAGDGTRLIGFHVRVDSLDVHTIGAVVHMADSLPGALRGSLVLDGPTSNVNFHDLRMRHFDRDEQQSTVSGAGRIASDPKTKWFEAQLKLDTLSVALFQPDSLNIPLRGVVSGTVGLSAIGDTMSIDARLTSGTGSAHLTGTALLDSTRTQMDMRGTLAGLDPGRFLRRRDIPALSLSGTARVAVDDDKRRVDRHVELHLDSLSRIGESPISFATLRFGQDSSGIHVDTLSVLGGQAGAEWRVDARGQLAAHGHSTTDSITFSTKFDSLGAVRSLLLDSTGAPRFSSLEGRIVTDSGVVRGSFEHASIRTWLGVTNVRDSSVTIGSALGQLDIRNLPDSATGTFRGTLTGIESGQWRLDTAFVTASIEGGARARVSGRLATGDSTEVIIAANVTWSDSVYRVHVDTLDAHVLEHRWHLRNPAALLITQAAVRVDSLLLESDHKATVRASGIIPKSGTIDATIQADGLGLSELALLGLVPEELTGRITASARITGTRDAPTIAAKATLDSVQSEERDARRDSVSIVFDGSYAAKKAKVSVMILTPQKRVLEAGGDIPLDLTFRKVGDRIIDAPMLLKVRADSLGLGLFDGLVPRITGLGGYLTTDLEIGGTLRRPRGSGSLALYEGAFDHRRFGISAEDASAVVKLAGDSVIIERLRMTDGESPTDTVSLRGLVQLTGRKWTEWTVDVTSSANRFKVIDDPRVAVADADWNLQIDGRLAVPHVRGNVRLPKAVFTIGPQRRPRTQTVTDSLVEVSVATPNLDGVVVSLGSDVRLKSRDANVQLEGDLELFGPMTAPWISGSVSATRGTYRVNVGGVITRTFRVDSGSVLLEGTPDMPPTLDIYTQYVVRRPDEDVVIRAHLYGTTFRPRLDLSSELGSAVSQSEIISYLVFGQPSFALQEGGVRANVSTAAAPILPTLGAWIEGALSGFLSPFFNTLQVTSTVSKETSEGMVSNPFETTLNSYSVTGGRQIGSDTFFSLSAGRCGASSTSSTGSVPLWGGAAIDYRPKRSVGASLSVDPGPAPCSRVSTIGDNTYQFGIDLSYDWRFGRKPPR